MENSLNLSKVPGTGRQGRVLKGDVLEFLNLLPVGTNIPHPTLAKPPLPVSIQQLQPVERVTPPKQLIEDRIEVLKGVRKIMFKTMTESLVKKYYFY